MSFAPTSTLIRPADQKVLVLSHLKVQTMPEMPSSNSMATIGKVVLLRFERIAMRTLVRAWALEAAVVSAAVVVSVCVVASVVLEAAMVAEAASVVDMEVVVATAEEVVDMVVALVVLPVEATAPALMKLCNQTLSLTLRLLVESAVPSFSSAM